MSYITDWVLSHRWAITSQALLAIVEIANRVTINIDPKIFHGDISTMSPEFKEKLGITKESLTPLGGRCLAGTCSVQIFGKVGVIDIFGPIFPRSSSMSLSSPGITVSSIGKAITMALESDEVESIILNIDSPGGEITDIEAVSEKIFKARTKKPIVAFVTGMAASAGYWIASSTSEIICAKTGEVGSIGVIAAIRDTTEKDEKEGIKNISIVSSVSPRKRVDFRTKEGQADIKDIVDELGEMFVEAVARNRNTDVDDVIKNFGQGSMILSTKAIEFGMVDKIDSLENLITEFNNNSPQLIGGITMDNETLIKNGTVETIKAENPALYQAIIVIGKAEGADELKAEVQAASHQEGVLAENDRIKSCETLITEDTKEVVEANKFDSAVTMDKMSSLILKDQKEKEKKAAKANAGDATELSTKTGGVDSGAGSGNIDDDCVRNMVAGGDERRAR